MSAFGPDRLGPDRPFVARWRRDPGAEDRTQAVELDAWSTAPSHKPWSWSGRAPTSEAPQAALGDRARGLPWVRWTTSPYPVRLHVRSLHRISGLTQSRRLALLPNHQPVRCPRRTRLWIRQGDGVCWFTMASLAGWLVDLNHLRRGIRSQAPSLRGSAPGIEFAELLLLPADSPCPRSGKLQACPGSPGVACPGCGIAADASP